MRALFVLPEMNVKMNATDLREDKNTEMPSYNIIKIFLRNFCLSANPIERLDR